MQLKFSTEKDWELTLFLQKFLEVSNDTPHDPVRPCTARVTVEIFVRKVQVFGFFDDLPLATQASKNFFESGFGF